ncbi:unnamed protein product [Paramecium sonneborni]|uniref:Uncharacterized protein n=1 Tax=Paramecium sonneborni TaxID=65129 RepID=A0A8S1KS10_9CILI|nr:unnamed protein product [Paramecium sonneborni]
MEFLKATNYILDFQIIRNNSKNILLKYNKFLIKMEYYNFGTIQEQTQWTLLSFITFIFLKEKIWQYDKTQQCIYAKPDFLYGFILLKAYSTFNLEEEIQLLRDDQNNNQDILKLVQRYCFDFGKQSKQKQDIDLPTAQGLLETILKNVFPIINQFNNMLILQIKRLKTHLEIHILLSQNFLNKLEKFLKNKQKQESGIKFIQITKNLLIQIYKNNKIKLTTYAYVKQQFWIISYKH